MGILAASIASAYVGIKQAAKSLGDKGHTPRSPAAAQIVGGTIIETTTLLMWSESNRDVVDSIRALTNIVREVCDKFDAFEELSKEATELRHQIERLRDKL